MSKIKTSFFCQSCGSQHTKWQGQCNACKQWNTLTEEIIEVNDPEFEPKSYIQMNVRTGKLERKKLKKDWINPTVSNNNDGDINHVARTPESELNDTENQKEYNKKEQRKLRRAYRRKPSGLSVTTGKYNRKKYRQKTP